MDFTKNADRSVTLTGTKESFIKLRDTVAEGWGEDDTLVEELNVVIEGESASTLALQVEPHVVGELVDVLEAAPDQEISELGDSLREMIDAHNDAAIREAEADGRAAEAGQRPHVDNEGQAVHDA